MPQHDQYELTIQLWLLKSGSYTLGLLIQLNNQNMIEVEISNHLDTELKTIKSHQILLFVSLAYKIDSENIHKNLISGTIEMIQKLC